MEAVRLLQVPSIKGHAVPKRSNQRASPLPQASVSVVCDSNAIARGMRIAHTSLKMINLCNHQSQFHSDGRWCLAFWLRKMASEGDADVWLAPSVIRHHLSWFPAVSAEARNEANKRGLIVLSSGQSYCLVIYSQQRNIKHMLLKRISGLKLSDKQQIKASL